MTAELHVIFRTRMMRAPCEVGEVGPVSADRTGGPAEV